jgi:NTP pyrophosphatase (non-canonical NTP hydrolase)
VTGFDLLENQTIDWAFSRGILEAKNSLDNLREAQLAKTAEEVEELSEAIILQCPDDVKDAIGDVLVTLIIQAELWDFSIQECLAHALSVIQKRTGKMEGMVFVKDE